MKCWKSVFLPMLTLVGKPLNKIFCLFTSLPSLAVCLFSLNVNKSCVHDIFPESTLNTDTQIIQTLLHVSPVYLLTGFHCIFVGFICTSVLFKKYQDYVI